MLMRDQTVSQSEQAFLVAIDSEYARLNFVKSRDGQDGVITFAKQTYGAYSSAINASKPSMATSREHRYKFIASIFVFEEILGLDITPKGDTE